MVWHQKVFLRTRENNSKLKNISKRYKHSPTNMTERELQWHEPCAAGDHCVQLTQTGDNAAAPDNKCLVTTSLKDAMETISQ